MTEKQIIEKIGYYLNLRNISSYKLGYMLGHAKTYFYRIESGEIQLTLQTFLEILDILQVSTEEFFENQVKNNEKELFEIYNRLSYESKQALLTIARQLH